MASIALNIAFAVFCVLSLGCGITYSVLISQLIHFIYHRIEARLETNLHGSETGVSTIMWMIGLAYIIPGVIGLIACLTRRRGVYVAHAILAIKGVVILVVLLMMGLASTKGTGGVHFCEEVAGTCVCHTQAETALLEYFSCHEINWMVGVGIGTSAMFWTGAVVSVIAAILAFVLIHMMRKEQLASQGGTVVSLPNVTMGQFGPNPYERFDK